MTEFTHKKYLSLLSLESRAFYTSARNHAKSVLTLVKHSLLMEKAKNFQTPTPLEISSTWPKICPITVLLPLSLFLFHPDGDTVIISVSEVELFSQTFGNNSTLNDSGFAPPSSPSSDYSMFSVKILRIGVFHALANLNFWKAYGPDGVSPICSQKL